MSVNVTRWLRGDASVHPYGSCYVRLWMERPGVAAEVYLTRAKARELYESLQHIFSPRSSGGGEGAGT